MRDNCTHFSSLKQKMTILFTRGGRGKISVWVSGQSPADLQEPALHVGVLNPFDVLVLLRQMISTGVLKRTLRHLIVISTPGLNLNQLNKVFVIHTK